ncbi:carotenoid biosynthesis protein [Nonomuraea guangzhouensis]|uniref:Carotenoid biosynthesis protein n=1 Tax=Nonomuraea guangzhouensis TaxID=1291555 RepID=A0ABW4G914_9ACTN|nr:carotenoid biosynthesis protein [Nonomuraea guangzhouensis]
MTTTATGTHGGLPRRSGLDGWRVITWVMTAAALAVALIAPLSGSAPYMFVLLLSIPLAFICGVRRYGAKALLLFFAVTFVVSNFFENLSISTGFPFGHYHYTGSPKLIDVPIFIGPIYFGLGYLCWQVANVLLDEADTRLSWRAGTGHRVNVVALPMTAAAIMTMFDLGSDSIASTVNHLWIWERGGGVFGVPYTNYLGWWLVTYLFFQIFALYLARRQAPVRSTGLEPSLQSVLVYAGLGLSTIPYFAAASGEDITDATGTVWNAHALNETMMTINLFTVVFVAFLALVKLARHDTTGNTIPTRDTALPFGSGGATVTSVGSAINRANTSV